jgi:hypothetical protein
MKLLLSAYACEPSKGSEPGVGWNWATQAALDHEVWVLTWTKFRGPGDVKFDNNKPSIDRAADGKAVTNATFSAPGDYILRVEGNDSNGSGGGGFQCCWSNAHVSVTVK